MGWLEEAQGIVGPEMGKEVLTSPDDLVFVGVGVPEQATSEGMAGGAT